MSTYQLNILYPKTVSLYKITSLIESVKGMKIKHLKYISREKDFIGTLEVETSDMTGFNTVIKLMRASKGLTSVIEK